MANIVYKILCRPTGRYYIGSSKLGEKRFYIHKQSLRANKHYSRCLQVDWNEYGEDAFDFIIIDHDHSAYKKKESALILLAEADEPDMLYNSYNKSTSPRKIYTYSIITKSIHRVFSSVDDAANYYGCKLENIMALLNGTATFLSKEYMVFDKEPAEDDIMEKKKGARILCKILNGKVIDEYPSIRLACEFNDCTTYKLRRAMIEGTEYIGYYWRYSNVGES